MNTVESFSWLIQYAIQTSVFLGFCLLLPRFFRIRNPEIRLTYYYALLAGVLCQPVLPSFGFPASGLANIPEIFFESTILADFEASGSADSYLISSLLWVLILFAFARFLMLGIGMFALKSYVQQATELESIPPAIARELQVGYRHLNVEVGLSSRISSPLSFGWKKPKILLPHCVAKLPTEQLEAVLRHELIHIRRNDWPLVVFEQIVKSIFWFHPFVRVLIDKIDLNREQVVDREVVRETGLTKIYLRTLHTIASTFRQTSVVPMIPFIRKGHLKKRVAQLKQEVVMSKSRRFVLLSVLFLLVSGAALVSASAVRFSPAFPPGATTISEPQEKGEKKKSEGSIQVMDESDVKVQLVKRVNPAYPEEAKKQGIKGKVVLKIKIGKDGRVVDVKIDESAHELLDNAAAEAVRKWEYTPPVLDGKPVEVLASVNIVFKLS
jgi:TonB family protein